MSDWRTIVVRAATLSSDAVGHLPVFLALLEALAAGRTTVADVQATLGTIADRRPGLLDALDAALRAGRRDEPGLAAARAVLFELPRLLDAVVAVPPLGPEPRSEGGAAATLRRLGTRAASPIPPHTTFACPRCGSRRVETQHTDAFARRAIEVRCSECGDYGAWSEGDADELAWHPARARPIPANATTDLTDAFTAYLRAGATEPQDLAAALRRAGHPLEGDLLGCPGWQVHGAWPRVFVGRRPPRDAAPGEVWLDSVEVTAMVLVEEPTYRADAPTRPVWLALRPVRRWQFLAFARAAPFVSRKVQIELQVKLLDPTRLAGDELAPMTSILCAEAELYAVWFGKVTGTRDAWHGAAHTLGARAANLWTPGLREWIGELCSFDESRRARIGPGDVDVSPDDDYIAACENDAEPRLLVDEAAHEPDTGMRTVAGPELLTSYSDTFRPFVPITLARVFPR